MTPAEHEQLIRQIQLQLTIADYGLGMPRDYQHVLYLRQLLAYLLLPLGTRDIVLRQAFLGIGFRWEAWHDGDDENHCGCGPTPAEAIADLMRLDQERAEALEGQDKPVKEQMIGHPMSAKTRQALDQIISSWKKEGRR